MNQLHLKVDSHWSKNYFKLVIQFLLQRLMVGYKNTLAHHAKMEFLILQTDVRFELMRFLHRLNFVKLQDYDTCM